MFFLCVNFVGIVILLFFSVFLQMCVVCRAIRKLFYDLAKVECKCVISSFIFNLLAPELFFLILAHPVYKMWITQEPNKLDLWNKLHFEEEKTESIYHVSNIQYLYVLNKYIKWNV